MKISIHILNIDNYFPELFDITFKSVERYASKINASINIINKRKFLDYPLLTEKLQIYDIGHDYDWNMLIDADILIHPKTPNPFITFNPIYVGNKDEYKADRQFKIDKYFFRDYRNIGLSSCLIATSRLTHDLWKFPKDLTKNEIYENILIDRKIVDEYVISRNLSKYGLKYKELFNINDYDMMFHLGAYDQDKDKILDISKKWAKKNSL